jgi:hypothetical protein
MSAMVILAVCALTVGLMVGFGIGLCIGCYSHG